MWYWMRKSGDVCGGEAGRAEGSETAVRCDRLKVGLHQGSEPFVVCTGDGRIDEVSEICGSRWKRPKFHSTFFGKKQNDYE